MNHMKSGDVFTGFDKGLSRRTPKSDDQYQDFERRMLKISLIENTKEIKK